MGQSQRVALIGYGYWGPNYARMFNELPGAELAGICEVNPERRKRAHARHPRVEMFPAVDELLRSSNVDCVVIATPATTHFEVTKAALESGKHVLVEKPLALSKEHCQELCRVTERTGRILMVAHTFLYNAGIRQMKECMAPQDFGHAYYLHSTRTNLGPIRNDVNAIWDLAPHDVSILNYLLGQKPEWASAIGSRVLGNSREDIGFITLGYRDGVIGNIHVSWADPNKVREVVAVGSKRRVVFNDLNDAERIRVYEKGVAVSESSADTYGEFKLLVRDGDIISPHIAPSEPLKNQCAEFLSSVVNHTTPLSDARFGTEVVETLLAAEASLLHRGAAQEI